MKQSKRILAYSALALIVMLAAFGAIAFDTSNVAHAQTVGVPTLTAQASGATTINLTWTAVDDAARYELWVWDSENEWQQIGGNSLTGTTWSHAGLTEGTTYYYQIRAITADGSNYGWSTRVNEVAGMAPDAPSLTATAGYLQITVSWPAVTGAARYELWAWDGSWTALHTDADPIIGTSYPHTGLTAGRTIYYQGRSVDSSGIMSAWSAQTSAEVLSSPNISAPTSFSAARGDGMITLSWGTPSNTAGLTITGYQYRYRESGGTFGAWTDAGNDGTETIVGLTNGIAYDFELQAVSSSGAVGATGSRTVTPSTVPGAPTLTATAGYQRIDLSWTAPADNGGAAISGYRIERQNSQGGWDLEARPVASATSHPDTGLENATEYTYRIFAINFAGDSEWTSASALTLANRPGLPAAPIASTDPVVAVSGPGSVTLNWQAPAFNGGAAILRYEYRYQVADSNSWTGWRSAGTDTTVKIDIAASNPAKEYEFEVAAVNSVGRGPALEIPAEDAAAVSPGNSAPTAAPNVSALVSEDGDSNDQVTLSWTGLTVAFFGGGTTLSSDNAAYDVQRKLSTAKWPKDDDADGNTAATRDLNLILTGTLYSALDGGTDGPDPGMTYNYRVRAVNSVGGGPWSTDVTVTTPPNPPGTIAAAPDVSGNNVNSIRITWEAPADTGGSAITGYELQVRTVNSTFVDSDTIIENLPGNRLEYIHEGVRSGVNYYYRVRAVNVAGKSAAWSTPSDMASVSTAPPGTPGAPGTITTGLVGSTVTFGWQEPTDRGTLPITGYIVQYQRDDDNTDADWSDAMTVTYNTPTQRTHLHMGVPGGDGVMWEYRVRAVNGHGPGTWSIPDGDTTITIGRIAIPARVAADTELTATAVSTDEIRLEWTKPEANGSAFTGYVIQRWDPSAASPTWSDNIEVPGGADISIYSDIGDNDNDGVIDTNDETALRPGVTYSYRIRTTGGSPTVNDFGSDNTIADADASAKTMSSAPTAAPVWTEAADDGSDIDDDAITIGWTALASADAGGEELTSYELNKWVGGAWVREDMTEADITSYEDEDLAPNTTYYYAVRARNSIGAGPWSEVRAVTTDAGVPNAPVLTVTATGRNSISVSWTVPNTNGTPITGYQLQRWNNETNGDWAAVNGARGMDDNTETVTQYTDVTGLSPGTKYYYRIRALTGGTDEAQGAWSTADSTTRGAASATTHGDVPGRMEAPTEGTDTGDVTASSIEIDWEPLTGDAIGGSPVTGYKVQIWDSATSSWMHEADVAGGSTTSYKDSGLTAGTAYFYRVAAVNSQGTGAYSPYLPTATSNDVPAAPVLSATVLSTESIRLTWTVPAANGNPITDYNLVRWDPDAEPNADWLDTDLLGTTTVVNLHELNGLTPGTTYIYRVQAVTTGTGGGAGAWSNQVTATTVAGAPGRPQMFVAAADGENAIDLSWQAPESNGGNAIIRYELERWDAATRSWVTVTNAVPANRTSYEVTGLTAGTRYVYRLRAVNRAPTNSGLGLWSTIATAATDAAEE